MSMDGVQIPPDSSREPMGDFGSPAQIGSMSEGDGIYGPAGNPARRLTHDEIKGILQREIEDALGGLGSQISEQRRAAIRAYYGRPIGNEMKDRSQIVSRDVLEVIEWCMPSLMRSFTGSDTVFRYVAREKGDEENARLATAYINDRFLNELDGFRVLYDWFKTALMEKNGLLKVYYQEKRHPVTRSYDGLSEDELAAILGLPGAEPMEHTEREDSEVPGVMVHDVKLRFWKVEKGLCVDGIPPEEFLAARRMIHLNRDSQFTAHRKKMSVSELVSMGFPFEDIARIPSDDTPEYSQGRTERLSEDETYPVTTAERTDAASREIWTTECYIRMDEDGDGYAELRKILIVGEQSVIILEDEEVEDNPFVSITPVPMPHKFFGQSLADLVIDLQVIRSTLMRMILDHIYGTVNQRHEVLDGMVDMDDMLSTAPGGVVRVREMGSIMPIQNAPLPREAFEALQYLEQTRGNRTGIMAHGREMDASAINSTATGMAQLMAEKQQKIELIARIFASQMKVLARKLLKITVENPTKGSQLRLNGRWIEINPADWDGSMGVEIEVGLGAGQAAERLGNIERIMSVQAAHVSNGGMGATVTKENLWASAVEMCEVAGFKNKDLFFQNPSEGETPAPPPDPAMEKIKAQVQMAAADAQAKAGDQEMEIRKQADLVRFREEDIASKEKVALLRLEMEERIALGQQQAQIESAEIAASARDVETGDEEESE